MDVDACSFCGQPVPIAAKHCPNCGQPHVLRDKYRIVGLLGRGGFGIVYEGMDLHLKRRYAIKVILSDSAAGQQQVLTEAEILAQHARRFPFMPEIYDIWHEGPRTTLVMEFVEGQTLGQVLGEGEPWPVGEVADFLRIVLADLARLHAVGIIHRDLKPDNIKRTPDGRYILLDFGIAKQEGSTLVGAKAFSPAYASPEQMRGLPTDARSDLYSLGATAYHLLTGQSPVPSEYRRSANITLPVPSDIVAAQIPPVLQSIILKMLSLDADARPADANAAMALLDAAAPDEPLGPKVASGPHEAAGAAIDEVVAKTTVMLQETISRVAEHAATGIEKGARIAEKELRRVAAQGAGTRRNTVQRRADKRARRLDRRRAAPRTGGLVLLIALIVAGAVWWRLTRKAPNDNPPGPAAGLGAPFAPDNAAQAVEAASFGRGSLEAVAFDPGGATLAVGTSLGVELWDAKTWRQTAALTGFVRPVYHLAWSSDAILATVNGPDLRLWTADGKLVSELSRKSGSSLDGVFWSPDGTRLIAIDASTLLLWDGAGKPLIERNTGDFAVTQVAWSPDSRRFAFGSFDGQIRIWGRDGDEIAGFGDFAAADPALSNWISALAWNADSDRLAIGAYSGEMGVWQSADGALVRLAEGHPETVLGLAWSPDSATLASSGHERAIRLWRNDALFKTIDELPELNGLGWDAGGEGFVAAGSDGTVRLFGVDGSALRTYESGTGMVRGLAQSRDGQLLVAFTESEFVHVWKRDGSQIARLEGYTSAAQGLSASPDGSAVAIDSWAWDVALWQPFDPKAVILSGHSNAVTAVAWSPDGATVAAAATDPFTRLWRPDGAIVGALEAKGVTQALAWNQSNVLAGGGSDGVVRLWKADGTLIKELAGGQGPIIALAWSPDGARLAVGCENGALAIWTVESGEKLDLKGHTEQIASLAWNPDGTRLVSGSWDDTARVWDQSGQSQLLPGSGSGDVFAVAWSPDGERIAVGAANGELRFWNGGLGLINVVNPQVGSITMARWNSHGVLATASSDGKITLWSADGAALATLSGHTDKVSMLAWAAGDTRLFSTSEDGTARLWTIGPR